MPLYEYRKNAENIIKISQASLAQAFMNTERTISELVCNIGNGKINMAIDGWYGVEFDKLIEKVQKVYGQPITLIDANKLYKPLDELKKIKQPNITDDPGFGYVNDDTMIEELFDDAKSDAAVAQLKENKGALIIYGYGAAAKQFRPYLNKIVYADKTLQTMLWQLWDGKLVPLGVDHPDQNYNWKEYYYFDFHVLYRHKKVLYGEMDYFLEATDIDSLKMVGKEVYDEIISTVVTYPIKQVQIFQPGPWGAYRYRDLWEVPGLECSAWNKMSGPEMSIIIDFGAEDVMNIPLINLLQYNAKVTGEKIAKNYPDLFPLDIWLDDGYFPEKTPAERTSMPIHNHPDSDYVKRHFNEPLGRYETYYIAEAYEGANTWMGFRDDCDLEEFEAECRKSNNLTEFDFKKFICNWKSNVGDLYLIPPGTAHGHGGNQMVLEMDTSPAIAGTEYSFFQYDFARQSWDDNTKTMTGKPLKMHLEHAFDNERYRRESFVKSQLRARPEIVKWTKDFYVDKYSTINEMPFDIERFFFDNKAENTTDGRFLQILTLTVGHSATIRSKSNPERCTQIERLQCVAIPACFGDYEIISDDGSACTVVSFYLKNS